MIGALPATAPQAFRRWRPWLSIILTLSGAVILTTFGTLLMLVQRARDRAPTGAGFARLAPAGHDGDDLRGCGGVVCFVRTPDALGQRGRPAEGARRTGRTCITVVPLSSTEATMTTVTRESSRLQP
ncbi:hypothetical protein GCM10018965_009210 [Nonomuraea roseola]